ncbi:LLGL scribble cell polarity complex component 2-like isoform X3 [Anneissia japonica]|uniref:LLGL scribble cell polarity complex component 2-like isoform X3 n=1 Tax=Anneissia japonica TaxID=1529436 RepID=UPI001425A33D|nr:LLGL scribble cell polarity complex component 2-like isoform X3 [Anneissia japonica]
MSAASKVRNLFKRKGGGHTSAERERQKKEIFAFNKTVEHGFPNKPTAIAYDPQLKLLALGTKGGIVKIFGAPGVEFVGKSNNDATVNKLFFLPNQGRLISLCDDNTLHLWEVNIRDGNSLLEEMKSFCLEGRAKEEPALKKITVCCLSADHKTLYLGTEGGNIYILDVVTFDLTDHIIYQDVVMQNVPDDCKVNPGAVEAIQHHPNSPDKLLIGYNRGLMVVWDSKEFNADSTFVSDPCLETLTWHRDGVRFTTAHHDGSYCVWNINDSTAPEKDRTTPYGPFPCKSIGNIMHLTTKSDPFLIFSGGMPRASYGDRHCVTVMQGKKNVVFDFTSRIIDFFTMSDVDSEYEFDEPHTLVVLVEEELVFIDLQSEGWPSFTLPYLSSLHASAITCSHHVSNVPSELWDKISAAGEQQLASQCSQREWPLNGGKNLAEAPLEHDLLMTGHEDGSIRFWDASTVSLRFLYKLSTAPFFITDADHVDPSAGADSEEEWPPFRKIGVFDPYSDDPRLGIQKMSLCSLSGTLVVAGTAGQVIHMKMGTEGKTELIETCKVQIVGEQDKFVWKGHEELPAQEEPVTSAAGFQPVFITQCTPPAAITALAVQTTWGVTAIGTSHGFALVDNTHRKVVTTQCTLNPLDLSATGEQLSKRKSVKKSLRATIRRMRKGRGKKHSKSRERREEKKAEDKKVQEEDGVPTTDLDAPADKPATPEPKKEDASPKQEEVAAAERKIEARGTDDSMTSMVRCLYFTKTFIRDSESANDTLWVGSNAGHVYIFTLEVPEEEKRESTEVTAEICKEIKLKHGAPVVSLVVVDDDAYPLPDPIDVKNERAKPANMAKNSLLICSEEQFKVFSLPKLRPVQKFKLTAVDGAKVRKVAFINFRSIKDDNVSENCVTCLTNLGDLFVLSIPYLRKQCVCSAISKGNVQGISSLAFTSKGEGFYLLSPSEFERFSLSVRNTTQPMCMLELPEGMRPKPVEPEPEPEPEPAAAAAAAAEPEPAAAEATETEAPADAAAPETTEEKPEEPAKEEEKKEEVEEKKEETAEITAGDVAASDDAKEQSADELVKEVALLLEKNQINTDEPAADEGDPLELVAEVNQLLAKSGIDVSMEGDTEENPDITVDEVKDYPVQDKTEEAATEEKQDDADKPASEEPNNESKQEELPELQIKEDTE